MKNNSLFLHLQVIVYYNLNTDLCNKQLSKNIPAYEDSQPFNCVRLSISHNSASVHGIPLTLAIIIAIMI